MEPDRAICPQCGAFNDAVAGHCVICGAPLNPYAGAPLPPPAAPVAALPVALPLPTGASAVPGARPVRRSLPPVGLALGVLGLCLVGLLAGGLFVLAAGSGALPFLAPPTATPVDPQTVLDQAQSAMAGVTTYRYVMTATFQGLPAGTAGSPTMTLRLVGTAQRPDRYTMRTQEFGDLIVIGEDAYLQNDTQPGWHKRAARDASPGLAPTNPLGLPRFLNYAHDPLAAPDVFSATQRLHGINFVLDVNRMVERDGAASTGTVLIGSQVTCDARIGADDHRLYRLLVTLDLPAARGAPPNTATIDVQLSDFNAPLTIAPPPDLAP